MSEEDFDGGEQWQEEFGTELIIGCPHLVHKASGCKWNLEIVVENLREQNQLCYNHLKECGK